MKKVINITLSSIVFAIEEDAHKMLAEYLEDITSRLVAVEDRAEVMSDIENAIAEKFIAAGKSEKLAVTLRDVEVVQHEMGAPSAFGEEEATGAGAPVRDVPQAKKRLFRDADDAVLAGVASGLARYFDIDPVIVRIAFVIGALLNGVGIIAYIILWVAVPKAETTAEKYAMKGKHVTIEDITNNVKKNLSESPLADKEKVNHAWQGVRSVFETLFSVFGVVARGVWGVARVVLGLLFVIGGAFASAGLISVYSVILLSEKTFLPYEAQQAVEIMLGNALGIVAISASFVMLLIPLLVLIVIGESLLKQRNLFTVGKTITLAVVWIIAIVCAGTTSALQVERVWNEVGGTIDIANYVDEDLVITVTEDGIDSNVPAVPIPDIAPDVRSALDGVSFSPLMTELDLSDRGLEGSLPAEIRLLSRLEILDVSNNNFTGVPAEIGQLSRLRILNLSNNQLTGLPYELGALDRLELLDVRGNNISQIDLDIITAQLPDRVTVLID